MKLNFPSHPDMRLQSANAIQDALQRAGFALQNRQPAEAERIAAEILRANPNEPRAMQMLAYALLAQDRPADAVAPLEQVARRTHDPAVATQLAMTLRRIGRIEDAVTWLRSAIEARPVFPPAFFELGIQLSALTRLDEAIDVLKRGIELAPNVPNLSLQLGHVYAGCNDRVNARACFMRVLALAPGQSEALLGLARIMQRDGDYASAAETFRRALAIKPDEAARAELGTCLLELGQADAALQSFRLAAGGTPQTYGLALISICAASRGRFWLKPSAAARAMCGEKS